jgi:hypothetical protein
VTRTTISLHESTLKRVREVARREHTTIGEAVTELLNLGLSAKEAQRRTEPRRFRLKSYSMGTPKVALEDKEALYRALDGAGS